MKLFKIYLQTIARILTGHYRLNKHLHTWDLQIILYVMDVTLLLLGIDFYEMIYLERILVFFFFCLKYLSVPMLAIVIAILTLSAAK